MERCLADRLVLTRQFKVLAPLPPGHPLRLHAAQIEAALPAMDEGAWSTAAEALSAIPRRSPFAPWRVFCRGMACFAVGDDDGLKKAVDLLPPDFPLAGVAAEWRRLTGARSAPAPEPVVSALWEGRGDAEALAGRLVAATAAGRVKVVEELLPQLAEAVYPEDPPMAMRAVIRAFGLVLDADRLSLETVHKMAMRLLPNPREADAAAACIAMIGQTRAPDSWQPAAAVLYFQNIGADFPDPRDRSLARGHVLERMARAASRVEGPFARDRLRGALPGVRQLTGQNTIHDPLLAPLELMLASLREDPDNREGYAFLLDLVRGRRCALSRVEKALGEMARRFPEDPDPWLALADIHYRKNAYRKAQKALDEAGERAPHDDDILDRQAVACLVSALQSSRRRKWELARADYVKAEAMERRRVEPVLNAAIFGLDLLRDGENTTSLFDAHLEPMAPADALRCLVLALQDRRISPGNRLHKAVSARLRQHLEQLGALSSDDVLRLLAPVEDLFAPLYDDLAMAGALEPWWDRLLARLEGDHLLTGIERLLDADPFGGAVEVCRSEIDRRLKAVPAKHRDPLLLFYLAVLRHHEGLDHDARRFHDVLRRADAGQKSRMRAAAVRLASLVVGPMGEALRRFDFDWLEAPHAPFGMPFGLDDGDDDMPTLDWLTEFDEEDLDDGPSSLAELAAALETLVTESGLRGASLGAIRAFARSVWTDPEVRDDFARVAGVLRSLPGISRELRLILDLKPDATRPARRRPAGSKDQLPLPF